MRPRKGFIIHETLIKKALLTSTRLANDMYGMIVGSNKPPYCMLSNDTQS